jgi:TRAP-type mannitol/chloroaromatic compound transport system substrate-binding protein
VKQLKEGNPVRDFLQAVQMVEIPPGELESTLTAWFKQVCASIASVDGNIFREKGLQIAAHLGVDGCEVGRA